MELVMECDDVSSKEKTLKNMAIIDRYHTLSTHFISCDPLPSTLRGCWSRAVAIVILAKGIFHYNLTSFLEGWNFQFYVSAVSFVLEIGWQICATYVSHLDDGWFRWFDVGKKKL